jgi:WD repeat-containing protein 37
LFYIICECFAVQEQLNRYVSESGAVASKENERPSLTNEFETSEGKKLKSKLTASGTKAGYKIRAQTSRIVSSFKTQSIVSSLVKDFTGHHSDGVWEVTASMNQPLIATASADHQACIWSIESGRCLLKYEGHAGSVNSIRFHPSKDMILTASGDTTAHIWLGAVNWESIAASSRRGHSSEEELEDDDEPHAIEERERVETLRTPLQEFSNGHTSVVVAADWIASSTESPTQIITASWDRFAIL